MLGKIKGYQKKVIYYIKLKGGLQVTNPRTGRHRKYGIVKTPNERGKKVVKIEKGSKKGYKNPPPGRGGGGGFGLPLGENSTPQKKLAY